MAKIKVKDLQVGMTLKKDVCDPNGRFLLGEGCELIDKHLKALNAWGVISVEVAGDDLPESASVSSLSPEQLKELEDKMKFNFQHNDMDVPFIKELSKVSMQYLIEQTGK